MNPCYASYEAAGKQGNEKGVDENYNFIISAGEHIEHLIQRIP